MNKIMDFKFFMFIFFEVCMLYLCIVCEFPLLGPTISCSFFLFIPIQKITATPVLAAVARMAGPVMAAGFTLPYWLR